MNKQQLEMNFAGSVALPSGFRRPRRVTRARWWFAQMRQVVDQALEWQPLPTLASEQASDAGASVGTGLINS